MDGTNNGSRLVHDQRRHLYKEFQRYMEFFRPRVFVMENVLGIRSALGGEYFRRIQQEARAVGYRVHGQIEKAFELGLPQKRERQLFIGPRLDLPDYFPGRLQCAPRACFLPPLWETIGDLPPVKAGEGDEQCDYDEAKAALLKHRFRLLDDDGEIYYEALSDDRDSQRAFTQLDDFERGQAGCTEILHICDGVWRQH